MPIASADPTYRYSHPELYLTRWQKFKDFIKGLFILKHAKRYEPGPSRTASFEDLNDTGNVEYRMIYIWNNASSISRPDTIWVNL